MDVQDAALIKFPVYSSAEIYEEMTERMREFPEAISLDALEHMAQSVCPILHCLPLHCAAESGAFLNCNRICKSHCGITDMHKGHSDKLLLHCHAAQTVGDIKDDKAVCLL